LLEACELLNGCNTGDAKITSGFRLPSKYVIHTVGPVWQGGKYREKELLASCYRQSLRIASENNIKTIAFPNISTGVYGFPKSEAASIAIETVQNYVTDHPKIDKVIFCCFDEENFSIYNKLISNRIVIKRVQSPHDIQIVADLAFTIWNEHYIPIIGQKQVDYMVNSFQSTEAIEKQINNENYEYYLIEHLSKPSGYISIKLMGNELFLSKFYIIKGKRGNGLGKEGLKFVVNRAKELGASAITLTVNKYNINSIKAYEKMGFKNTGAIVSDIGAGFVMDDFKMRYDL
jgi:O-acetyl-ADP-ribose deacetylase (regulator of RNase III)/predicted acetyltransferase